jgi:putative DNA primase/helicase
MTDWTAYPNVWGCIIGRPGTMKSPAVAEALRPLRRIEARAQSEYDERMREFEGEAELANLRREAAKAAAKKQMMSKSPGAVTAEDLRIDLPDAPILRRYTANDSSHEALGELMRQNPNGLLVERDELASMLSHLSSEENANARGFFLTGADATSGYTFDRIGRGLNRRVPVVCLSMLGTTQPGRIASFLRQAIVGGDGDDGLMQRFGLIVWPDHGSEWRNVDRWPDTAARTAA